MPHLNEKTVAFLGLGLISGSLAGALRASGWRGELLGWGPRQPSLERGKALGLIDRYSLDLESVVADADMIIVGAPPQATVELLPEVIALARSSGEPIVTDLASIKSVIVDAVQPAYSKFVPGHPIAGSEHSGVDASVSTLFAGREVILTPTAESDTDAVQSVRAVWELTGARVTLMPADDHDAALAASSHVPHMMAYALTAMLGDHALAPMKHGGGALRDMTRIAASDPVMWRDIALTNREAILEAMDAVAVEHERLRRFIAEADGDAMQQLFDRCRDIRRSHDDVLNPLLKRSEREI